MIFTLDDKPVCSPHILMQECERLGLSTEQWLGKANCFVDRYGADPSYGYFLVNHELILIATTTKDTSGSYVATTGSNKFTLKIVMDEFQTEGPDKGKAIVRTIEDMYVESYINVTPSYSPENSYYLLKLVDARYVFSDDLTTEAGLAYLNQTQWWNKVVTYLNKEDLKTEFELDTEPEFGHFIYDQDTVDEPEGTTIGTREGVDIKIPKPLDWIALFKNLFTLFGDSSRSGIETVFPYFEKNTYTLILDTPEDMFPKWTPQDICLKYVNFRDLLDQLLFWSGTSIKYTGKGRFEFFKVENKDKVVDGNDTTDLDDYLVNEKPRDIVHYGIVSAGEVIPDSLLLNMKLAVVERHNNEIEEYHQERWKPDHLDWENKAPINERKVQKLSLSIKNVVVPFVWVKDREEVNELPEEETWEKIKLELHTAIENYFHRLPSRDEDYNGFLDLKVSPFLERLTWYDLANGPVTKMESVVLKKFDKYRPKAIIPRENKLSIIIAKVKEDVEGDEETFEIYDRKLIVGELFPTIYAYNTVKRSYIKDEEIILVGGYLEDWRHASLLLPDTYTDEHIYFTLDDVPYLRLKLYKTDLEEQSSGAWRWRYSLDNNHDLVNGKHVRKDPDLDEEIVQYLYIKDTPKIELDDLDEFIYIGYDITAGDDVFHRWSTADAMNDILFLKGLPGYDKNPTVPEEGQRRKVLKTPYDNDNPIGWVEEAADGRTDEELEQFIIEIINENGGGGSGGGGATILKGLINNPGGYASSVATVNWDGGEVLVSDGSVQPTSGAADNTFNTPFVNNEPVLLLKKNNGIWTVIKVRRNLIKALANADVRPGVDFSIVGHTAIVGDAPDGSPTAVGDEAGYMLNEPLVLEQTNDNKWRVLRRIEQTAMFRTTGIILAASFNTGASTLSIGSGNARKFKEHATTNGLFDLEVSTTVIKNMAFNSIAANRNVQCKKIGRYWFVDVEACG